MNWAHAECGRMSSGREILGDTESGETRFAVRGQQDITGCDVAMDHAALMQPLDRTAHLGQNRSSNIGIQGAGRGDGRQRPSIDVVDDEIRVAARQDADREDRDEQRVVCCIGQGREIVLERRCFFVVENYLIEHVDGNFAPRRDVLAAVNDPGSAASDLFHACQARDPELICHRQFLVDRCGDEKETG